MLNRYSTSRRGAPRVGGITAGMTPDPGCHRKLSGVETLSNGQKNGSLLSGNNVIVVTSDLEFMAILPFFALNFEHFNVCHVDVKVGSE